MSEQKECKCHGQCNFTGVCCKKRFPEQKKVTQKVKLLSEVMYDDLTAPSFDRDVLKETDQ